MPRIKLYRIGSDPEFVFTRVVEWQTRVVAASTVISPNRAVAMETYIGTDGHQATAELRPTPSHNVKRHLYDVAFALINVEDHIKKFPDKFRNVSMAARPVIGNEPLGGHIHVSFFVDDPNLKLILSRNMFHNGEQFVSWNANIPQGRLELSDTPVYEAYAASVRKGQAITPAVFANTMGYLLLPLERWVQPWYDRITRNSRYGTGEPVRNGSSPRPPVVPTLLDKWAYLHFEYRIPSTWLIDPWMAYLYLAMTKLVMLNFDEIRKRAKTPNRVLNAVNDTPMNDQYYQQLTGRLGELKALPEYRLTSDLRDIPEALDYARGRRDQWFSGVGTVDMSAWRKAYNGQQQYR